MPRSSMLFVGSVWTNRDTFVISCCNSLWLSDETSAWRRQRRFGGGESSRRSLPWSASTRSFILEQWTTFSALKSSGCSHTSLSRSLCIAVWYLISICTFLKLGHWINHLEKWLKWVESSICVLDLYQCWENNVPHTSEEYLWSIWRFSKAIKKMTQLKLESGILA